MARIVVVHGIGKQVSGPELLASELVPALQSGVTLAGGPRIAPEDVKVAFYGNLFRRPGTRAGTQGHASDDLDAFELDLLTELWTEAARTEQAVPAPDGDTRGRTPRFVQRALDALSHSRFFAGMADRMLIASLKQVRGYLTDPAIRSAAQQRVLAAIGPDTRLVIGHSLGSVVAYETLAANPVTTSLITLGSPLGIRNLIFDRLVPAPDGGMGRWPGAVTSWTNVADSGDVVALVKKLADRFDGVSDLLVHNGAKAHDCRPYLTAEETGHAIGLAL